MSGSEADRDPREELADITASVRAYVEWQLETGAVGAPRGNRARSVAVAVQAAPVAAVVEPMAKPAFVQPVAPAAAPPAPAHNVDAATVASSDPFASLSANGEESRVVSRPSEAPRGPVSLPLLAEEVASCTKCGLSRSRTQTVFSRGNPQANLVFVGEAPGADEDAQGKPFVGRAGQLLDKMIAAMGLDSEKDVYICNIIKCRPPANRNPEPDEIAACMPYLHAQLDTIKPKAIVAMGNTAVQSLLGSKLGITKVRGEWKLYKGTTLVMPTYHPSYLIRPSVQQAEAKRQAWEDLQAVMKELGLKLPARK